MRIRTSKSEGHGSRPENGGGEVLPQVEEFKHLGVLFTSEGKMEHEREIDRRIGAVSAVMRSVYQDRRGEEGAELKGEALNLPVNLRSHLTYGHKLWDSLYMDDLIASASNVEEAYALTAGAKEILADASMNLCKWTSSPELKNKWLNSDLDFTQETEAHGCVLK
ncbi:hypothetical protein L3Q82_022322, partial [Scortum barcoo]